MVKLLDKLFGKSATPFNAYPQQVDIKYMKTVDPTQYELTPISETISNVFGVDDLQPFAYAGQGEPSGYEQSYFDGGKFFGGFGVTQVQTVDYWTLRARSAQLFTENLYAAGLIRRLITNEINTGLTPEAAPDEVILRQDEDALQDWTEIVENRFSIWAQDPKLCDYKGAATFGALQRAARQESLIAGDVLVVLRNSQRTRLPQVQLIRGDRVQTPYASDSNIPAGHEIHHGVELDSAGRHVAFWVRQKDGSFKRLPAEGARSGRRLAWLVYGTDKRLDDVRGQPLLSIVLQSLKEIDRYRDSTQRKALVNSFIAAYITKEENKMGTLPISGGAVRKEKAIVTDSDGKKRNFNFTQNMPGMVIQELQQGEKPVFQGGGGTDLAFREFEEAIIAAVAWANEIPPEILTLAFSNNYSASQAAINEFKIYLNKIWSDFGETFCGPIYQDWLLSEVLQQRIRADGFLEAYRDPSRYDVFGAWVMADWYGSIKPSTDMLKQARGSELLVKNGWSNNARESRTLTGTKFSKNMKRIKREQELLVESLRPMAEFRKEFGEKQPEDPGDAFVATASSGDISAVLDEMLEDRGIVNAN